jgi:hypothetical protein
MLGLERGGHYFRVCDPGWRNPLDTSFARARGGRWNPPGLFGALYLNATILVAAANARLSFSGEIASLYDLQPAQRPDLLQVTVSKARFVDAVTRTGLRSLRLPSSYPIGVPHARCQRIAKRAFDEGEPSGVAYRSNAEATPSSFIGEELAVFDRASALVRKKARLTFSEWYPTEAERRGSTPRRDGRDLA